MLAYVQYLSKLFKQEEPSYVLSANADKLVLISRRVTTDRDDEEVG